MSTSPRYQKSSLFEKDLNPLEPPHFIDQRMSVTSPTADWFSFENCNKMKFNSNRLSSCPVVQGIDIFCIPVNGSNKWFALLFFKLNGFLITLGNSLSLRFVSFLGRAELWTLLSWWFLLFTSSFVASVLFLKGFECGRKCKRVYYIASFFFRKTRFFFLFDFIITIWDFLFFVAKLISKNSCWIWLDLIAYRPSIRFNYFL